MDAASYLHCIARRTAPSTLLRGPGPPDAPGVHRVPISMQPPGRTLSLAPSLPHDPCVGRDELKRPENSLRIARDRSRTRDRGPTCTCVYVCFCVYGVCQNYWRFLRSKIDWFLGEGRRSFPERLAIVSREEFR